MRRILIFSTAYLPMVGGAEIAVKEITDRLPDFEFDLICAKIRKDLPKEEKIGRVHVRRVGGGYGKIDKFLLPWRGFKLAKQLYDKKEYDLVWAIMASFGGLTALFFKKHFPGVPYILTLQEGDTPAHIYSRARWLGPYYRRIFKKADYLTVISRYLEKYALQQGANCPIKIVPNGVDLRLFSQEFSEQQISEIKNKLGKKPGDIFLIHTGRLVVKNALDDVIRALRLLSSQVKFLVLGVGPDEEKLKKLAGNLGAGDRVMFLGLFNHQEMLKYLRVADIFIRPSLSEGLGNSFLEAMAAGIPVIGTKVGGIPDFLKDPSQGAEQATGLFCEVRNPKSIAEKITLLLADEILRQRLIANARKLVEEKYNWDNIAQKMGEIFEKTAI